MRIETSALAPLEFETPCLVLPVWQGEELSGPAVDLNEKLGGLIAQIVAEDGFKAAPGDTRTLYAQGAAPRVMLLGVGKRDKVSLDTLRRAFVKAARAVRSLKRGECALALPECDEVSPAHIAGAAVETLGRGDPFGEMALIDQAPRAATATAKTACQLAVLPEKRFLFLVQTKPHFALDIMRAMAQRLRTMNAKA